MAEEVDGEGGTTRERDLRRQRPPEKARGTKAVQQDDWRPTMAIALHVNGARPHGYAQQIGVDGTLLFVRG